MDAKPCPGPGQPSAPAYRLPRNTCDTHVHVVGPFDRYPLVEKRMYTPPEATAEDLGNYLRTSRIDRVVVVHVTVAGTTPDITLDAMAQLGDSARGAVLPDASVSDEQIAAWHEAGIRGARVTGFGAEPLTEAKIRTIADKVAPYGWHLLYMSLGAEEWDRLLPVFLDLPVPGLRRPHGRAALRLRCGHRSARIPVASQDDKRRDDMGESLRLLPLLQRPDIPVAALAALCPGTRGRESRTPDMGFRLALPGPVPQTHARNGRPHRLA